MVSRNALPDLTHLTDAEVIEELRRHAQLTFNQALRCKQRIDDMQGEAYAEALRLVMQLEPPGE
ncbi:MAG: hypothetical protein PHO20_04860 [Candidatus Peribacteraceae bacterium]|nr:hypothetical protein [Candidatus Peribacteraceae bacterium]MDD5740066.1 hypothetical protein [Candidatus Peribacteraceae bacterium]